MHPSNESWLGIFLFHEVFDGRMICVYYHLVAYKIWPKLIKCKNNSQQFFLICGIIQLCFIQSVTGIIDIMEYSIPLLSQYCPHRVITCITHELERELPIRCNYYMRLYQLLLQDKKCLVTILIKDKRRKEVR